MQDMLSRVLWGNSVQNYILVALGIFVTWAIIRITKKWLIKLLRKVTSKTETNLDDLLVEAVDRFVIPFLYLFINYTIINLLSLSAKADRVLAVAVAFVSVYYIVRLVNFIIEHLVVTYLQAKGEAEERILQVKGMLMIVKVLIWAIGLVMLAGNLGYDVTTVIAGLGVGGIAIALAAQNILGDLFSYIVIFFDKPFEIGDFIVTGTHNGVVEKIGIKTSHVRSPDGQQLIMPNAEMVKSVIQNFKRLERRRVVFSIGVTYDTSPAQIREIPDLFKSIVSKQEHASFDRAHFKSFGESSINFEIAYYIESSNFLLYMDTHQAVCMDIFEQFGNEGIEFAFPTQTLFLAKQPAKEETSSPLEGN